MMLIFTIVLAACIAYVVYKCDTLNKEYRKYLSDKKYKKFKSELCKIIIVCAVIFVLMGMLILIVILACVLEGVNIS